MSEFSEEVEQEIGLRNISYKEAQAIHAREERMGREARIKAAARAKRRGRLLPMPTPILGTREGFLRRLWRKVVGW